ncbi:unnamed protein product [Lymnaea stagnalis]|uniref:Uncharacterized protein n=1 Tax=Lymnaea stagnalis TaxID=6523 RepID=A0AAV2IJH0_LYMST
MDQPPLLNMGNAEDESTNESESEDESGDESGDSSDDDESSSDDDDVGRLERRAFIEENLNQFPCTFNIGRVNYNYGGQVFNNARIRAPSCRYVNWENFVASVIVLSHDDHWEPLTWLQNLRIRAYVELGLLEEARKLVQEILYRTGDQNITTSANLAVLHFVEGNVQEAQSVVTKLNERSRFQTFRYLKADAVCEQAYIFYVLSGAVNNISGIELLHFALRERCIRDRTQATLMLGTLYRRCLHWNTYEFDRDRIDFCEFARRAYDILNNVRLDPEVESDMLKANAAIELAFLHHDVARVRGVDVQDLDLEGSVEELCNEAVSIAPGSAKVTSIAGQLLKHIPHLASTAKYLLEKSLEIRPSARVFHHLGLMLLREANTFEETHANVILRRNHLNTSPFYITRVSFQEENLHSHHLTFVRCEHFSKVIKMFDSDDTLPIRLAPSPLQEEEEELQQINQESNPPRLQRPNTMDGVLDSILAEARNIPPYSGNNPHIQNATNYLYRYFHLSDFDRNLQTVVALGFAFLKCRQYALAFYIFEKFHLFDEVEIPGIILAFAYKMLTFCSLLNADLHRSLAQKRFMREISVSFLIKAVGYSKNIPCDESSRLEPRQMLECIRNIPRLQHWRSGRFQRLRN